MGYPHPIHRHSTPSTYDSVCSTTSHSTLYFPFPKPATRNSRSDAQQLRHPCTRHFVARPLHPSKVAVRRHRVVEKRVASWKFSVYVSRPTRRALVKCLTPCLNSAVPVRMYSKLYTLSPMMKLMFRLRMRCNEYAPARAGLTYIRQPGLDQWVRLGVTQSRVVPTK